MPSLIACSTNPTATVLRYFILGVKLSLIAYNNATLAIVLYLSYSKCLTRFLTFFQGLWMDADYIFFLAKMKLIFAKFNPENSDVLILKNLYLDFTFFFFIVYNSN